MSLTTYRKIPGSMEDYCQAILQQLSEPIHQDPIERCPPVVRSKLLKEPQGLIELADKELRVFPFSEVHIRWRRLYTDASIAKAAMLILAKDTPTYVDEVVRTLDLALIMTGAPLRETLIEKFLETLDVHPLSSVERAKCGSEARAFKTSSLKPPELVFPVPKSSMSMAAFEKHLKKPAPHVIKGAIEAWPASHERPWMDPDYLLSKTLGGRRLVPVELGRSYTDDDWGQRIITFREFIDDYLLKDEGDKIGYLAQHDLFTQIPALRKDICIPDFCYTSPPPPAPGTPLYGKDTKELSEPYLNAWFGPAGTISPLHTDAYHNILCQVVGKKYIRLYSPEQSEKLYPRGTEGEGIDMSNTSRVPVEEVEMGLLIDDDNEFPMFADAEYVETVLHEGECLYIPVGWWHYVRSLTTSFSVSFWWN